MLSRVSAGDVRPESHKHHAQGVESPLAVVPHADALGRRHSVCSSLASVSATSTAVAGYADPNVKGSGAWSCGVRRELPILRAQYVARGVRVLAGSRWRLNRFQERTIVLRTGAEPTLAVYAEEGDAAFEGDRSEMPPETTYVLPLNTTCELIGSSGGGMKTSLATGIQLLSSTKSSGAFRLRIRFATAADASIWCSIVRETLVHARWSRDVRPVQQEGGARGRRVCVVQHVHSSQRLVVKVLSTSDELGDCHELQILRCLYTSWFAQDVGLVHGYRVVETPEEVLLIMPELPGTTLLQFLRQRRRKNGRKLNEEEARRLLEKLATLLQAVHRSGVVHCDLNLENVLVNSGLSQAWIIDFGGAYSLLDCSSSWSQVMTGTPGYVAPERVQDPLAPPTPQADVFSLGILLFQALTGQHPYLDASKRSLQLSDSLLLDWPRAEALLTEQAVSLEWRELVREMLVADPHARISLDKLLETVRK